MSTDAMISVLINLATAAWVVLALGIVVVAASMLPLAKAAKKRLVRAGMTIAGCAATAFLANSGVTVLLMVTASGKSEAPWGLRLLFLLMVPFAWVLIARPFVLTNASERRPARPRRQSASSPAADSNAQTLHRQQGR